MKDRVKLLRRELRMTQAEFGGKLGINASTVAGYEVGRIEPSSAVITGICKEFHVSREWLVEGKGEMFVPAPTTALEQLARERGMSKNVAVMIEKFLDLPDDIQNGIISYIQDVASAIESEQDEIERKVEQYRQQLIEEKKTREDTSASSGSAGNSA